MEQMDWTGMERLEWSNWNRTTTMERLEWNNWNGTTGMEQLEWNNWKVMMQVPMVAMAPHFAFISSNC